jgi:hypothetical protein
MRGNIDSIGVSCTYDVTDFIATENVLHVLVVVLDDMEIYGTGCLWKINAEGSALVSFARYRRKEIVGEQEVPRKKGGGVVLQRIAGRQDPCRRQGKFYDLRGAVAYAPESPGATHRSWYYLP